MQYLFIFISIRITVGWLQEELVKSNTQYLSLMTPICLYCNKPTTPPAPESVGLKCRDCDSYFIVQNGKVVSIQLNYKSLLLQFLINPNIINIYALNHLLDMPQYDTICVIRDGAQDFMLQSLNSIHKRLNMIGNFS